MAKILVEEIYPISIQARNAIKFIGKDGKEVNIEASGAREATAVLAKYEDYQLVFVLPEHYDVKKEGCKVGSTLNVTCPDLEEIEMLKIKNVNRTINTDVKKV